MQITILGPQEWRKIVALAFASADDYHARLALCILRFMHDRHVGITPVLAISFVHATTHKPQLRRGDTLRKPWGKIFERLSMALQGPQSTAGAFTRKSRITNPRIWTFVPQYILLSRVVLPLCIQACQSIGRNVLFGSEPIGLKPGIDTRYDTYDEAIANEVGRRLDDEEAMTPLFWKQVAFDAYGAALRLSGFSGKPSKKLQNLERSFASAIPEADGAVIAYLERINPELTSFRQKRRAIRHRRQSVPIARQGLRPKEGGVEGIRQSRNMDDLEDVVFSELILPPIIFIDRLLHDGFLVRHRPPRRWPKREALYVALMPTPTRSEGERFAKVAWLDALCRVGLLLRSAGYSKVDMCWIEARSEDQCTFASVDLSAMPDNIRVDPWTMDRSSLIKLIVRMGWLPGIVDQLSSTAFRTVTVPDHQDSDWRLSNVNSGWLKGAMKLAVAAQPGGPLQKDNQVRAEPTLDDYGAVHAFIIQSATADFDTSGDWEWAAERIHLLNALGLSDANNHSVSLCLTPARIEPDASYSIWPADWQNHQADFGSSDEDMPDIERLNRAAGALVVNWVDIAVRVINGE